MDIERQAGQALELLKPIEIAYTVPGGIQRQASQVLEFLKRIEIADTVAEGERQTGQALQLLERIGLPKPSLARLSVRRVRSLSSLSRSRLLTLL